MATSHRMIGARRFEAVLWVYLQMKCWTFDPWTMKTIGGLEVSGTNEPVERRNIPEEWRRVLERHDVKTG